MIFTPKNKLRIVLSQLICHPYFDKFIYTMIGFSSILLAIDEPSLSPYSKQVLDICHSVTFVVFLLEAVIKIIVFNFNFENNPFIELRKRFLKKTRKSKKFNSSQRDKDG